MPTHRVGPVAIEWYSRESWPLLCAIFPAADLPASYEAWLAHAERFEDGLKASGVTTKRVEIEPRAFTLWCFASGRKLDRRARMDFVQAAVEEEYADMH